MSLSPSRRFHVVSLQVPFPPDYGGVIDIYYKLKALKKMGYETWLHTFQYDRSRAEQLNEVAARVSYYPRHRSVIRQLSHIPYIVSSRHCSKLLDDLLSDNAPILFEGLHCCAFLSDKRLKDRIKLVRTHNIEHEYYKELSRKTSGWKKLYYELEAVKLAKYEKILLHADAILAISESDRCYFSSRYPQIPVSLLPAFHAYAEVAPAGPKENYITETFRSKRTSKPPNTCYGKSPRSHKAHHGYSPEKIPRKHSFGWSNGHPAHNSSPTPRKNK